VRHNTTLRICIAAMLATGPALPAADYAGFVLAVNGGWRVLGAADPLVAGEKLQAGARVLPPSDPRGAKLTIVRDDQSAIVLDCQSKPADCGQPFELSTGLSNTPPLYRRLIGLVTEIFAEHPTVLIATGARGSPVPLLREILTTAGDGKVDVSEARSGSAQGLFRLKVTLLKDGSSVAELPVDWRNEPPPKLSAPVQSMPPGLYRLQLLDWKSGTITLDDSLALVSPASSYARDRANYEQAQSAVNRWDAVSAADKRIFLRVCLVEMAGSTR
jgi:hypothetical protein